MKRLLLMGVVVVGALLLISGASAVLFARGNPLDAVRAEAAAKGEWDVDELVTLEGGYSSHFLSRSAYGRFQPRGDESAEVYVELDKPTPLSDWRLVTYRVDRQSR